jgi:hypothetical protein
VNWNGENLKVAGSGNRTCKISGNGETLNIFIYLLIG